MASNPNSTLNDTLVKIQHTLTKNMFKNKDLVKPSLTEKIHKSIFTYHLGLGVLFCSHCRISLGRKSFEAHFRDNHVTMLKDMKQKKELSALKATVQSLTYHSIDQVQAHMVPDTFFFTELDVNMNGFKCRDCTFVHPDRKQLRAHHNKTHETVAAPKGTNMKATFVMENVPLQTLGGFDKNKKVFFIPKLPQHTRQAQECPTEDVDEGEDADYYSISETEGRGVSQEVSAAIIESYKTKMQEDQEQYDFNNPVLGNTKLLNSFFKYSHVLEFLKEKDKTVLLELVGKPGSLKLDADLEWKLALIEEHAIEFINEIHSKVNNLVRSLRQALRTETQNKARKEMADFRALESTSTREYFKLFPRLFSFLTRGYYIQAKFEHSQDQTKEAQLFRSIKDLKISNTTRSKIRHIVNLDVYQCQTNETKRELYFKLAEIFQHLLKEKNRFTFKKNTTMNNCVIAFYFINTLNPHTEEFNNMGTIANLSSKLIYNSRIWFLAYFSMMEEKGIIPSRELDVKMLTSIQEDLSNNSRNYFEELTQLRAYTLSLNRSAVSTNFIIGESTPNVVDYNNIPYPIPKMREFFQHIGNKLEVILLRDLIMMKNLADTQIPFSDIIDTPLLSRVNDSIADVPVLARYKTFFLEQLLTTNSMYNKVFIKNIRDDNSLSFNKKNIRKFTQSLDSFTELLAISVYLFSGGPLNRHCRAG